MVFYSVIVGIYYNMIIAYAIFYFFSSLTSKLPWAGCDSFWTISEENFLNNITVMGDWFLFRTLVLLSFLIQLTLNEILVLFFTVIKDFLTLKLTKMLALHDYVLIR